MDELNGLFWNIGIVWCRILDVSGGRFSHFAINACSSYLRLLGAGVTFNFFLNKFQRCSSMGFRSLGGLSKVGDLWEVSR